MSQSEWIPIGKLLPPIGKMVVVFYLHPSVYRDGRQFTERLVTVSALQADGLWTLVFGQVTHWLALPDLPPC